MITLDFLVTVLVMYGIVKLFRTIMTPSSSSSKPKVQSPVPKTEIHAPAEHREIVDATFEEIE